MAHFRKRIAENIIINRMKLHPVVGVLGVRQCGKSILLREYLAKELKASYFTMDSKTQRDRAIKSPEAFSETSAEQKIILIDEVQKVPDLFDAIKLHVDERRRPGTYVISGSTEFSKASGIRESLTGRIGMVHLYPMTLEELHLKKFSEFFIKPSRVKANLNLAEFDKKIERGGMPGICFLRSEREFQEACSTWLDTTCNRDLQRAGNEKLNGDLALEVLATLCLTDEPTLAFVARKLKREGRSIAPYLEAFVRIFVLHRLNPHRSGVGKAQYLLCDSGIARHLGASRETQIRIHLLNEALCSLQKELTRPRIGYFRNEKYSRIPLVFDWPGSPKTSLLAIQFCDAEAPSRYDLDSLLAFKKRIKGAPARLLLLTQARESYVDEEIEVYPLR